MTAEGSAGRHATVVGESSAGIRDESNERKSSYKLLWKGLRKQLGYVARDLSHLDRILKGHPDALSSRQQEVLAVIRT